MDKLIVKVARKGEGKTKWLLEVANKYQTEGRSVYLYTNNTKDYERFCEKYFTTYSSICKVNKFTFYEPIKESVILIDNLLSHDLNMSTLNSICNECYQIFITIDGSSDAELYNSPIEKFEQLSIFDALKQYT